MRPVTKEQELQIIELLKDSDLTQRKIAKMVGVCRVTVNNRFRRILNSKPKPDTRSQSIEFPDTTSVAVKCPTCGGKVYLPCMVCQLRGESK